MKVISLLQPWATLVVIGAKKFETRSWNTFYRGTVLIHASKAKKADSKNLCIIDPFEKFIADFDTLPFGSIIGSCKITATASAPYVAGVLLADGSTDEVAFGDYSYGRRAWKLENPVAFKIPIPMKGSLSLWDCPIQICMQCGCTGNDCRHCIERTGMPCHWVAPNLCSACYQQ